MMRHHFEQTRSEGVHLSALHASEPGIYGRHGYGIASLELELALGRGTTFTAPHLDDEAAGDHDPARHDHDDGMAERRRADRPRPDSASNVGTIVGSTRLLRPTSPA